MSEHQETPKDTKPDEIPPPPPIMPKPDIIDPQTTGPTYGGTKDKKRSKKEQRKRNHPLDPYEPLKKRKGCSGCCGCAGGVFALVAILLIGLIVAVGWFGPGRYVFQDYEVVSFEEAETTISEAPAKPTYYIGQSITYDAPSTDVPIAILGSEVVVSGYFAKDLSLSAAKVYGKSDTTIEGNLEVYAAEFHDEGITLKGELSGSVMKNIAP